jgi:hypothetical protein
MKPNCVSGGQHKFAENGERSEKQRRRGEPVGISVRIGESAVAQSERQQTRGGGSTADAAGIAVTCRVGDECACRESGAGSRDSGFCVASEWEGWGKRSCFDTQVRKELQQLPSRRWPKHRQFHHGQQCLDQLLWEQYGDIFFTLLTKLCKFSLLSSIVMSADAAYPPLGDYGVSNYVESWSMYPSFGGYSPWKLALTSA